MKIYRLDEELEYCGFSEERLDVIDKIAEALGYEKVTVSFKTIIECGRGGACESRNGDVVISYNANDGSGDVKVSAVVEPMERKLTYVVGKDTSGKPVIATTYFTTEEEAARTIRNIWHLKCLGARKAV